MMQVHAARILDLSTLPEGWRTERISVGPRGEVVLLLLDESFSEWVTRGGVTRPLPPYRFRIAVATGGGFRFIVLPETRALLRRVQPFGDGRWVAVDPRSRDGAVANAFVYTEDGSLLSSFSAGDGIEDVQVTQGLDLWISYFDEGVFSGTEPSNQGVVCFTEGRALVFRYHADVAGRDRLPPIDDCYAMNVVSDREVWLYYYSDFPLVQLVDKRLARWWPNLPVRGSHAFAVWDERVLFAGQYREPERLWLLRLNDMRVDDLVAVDDRGEPIHFNRSFGRSSCLYLRTAGAVYRLDLQDLRLVQ